VTALHIAVHHKHAAVVQELVKQSDKEVLNARDHVSWGVYVCMYVCMYVRMCVCVGGGVGMVHAYLKKFTVASFWGGGDSESIDIICLSLPFKQDPYTCICTINT
jgi:hypothetical protein